MNADVVGGLQGARATRSDAGRRAPYRGCEVGIAASRAGRIGDRIVDQRGRQSTIVSRRTDRRDRARRLVGHQCRHVVAGLVVEAERVVPRLAAQLVEVAVDRCLLRVDLRLRQPTHQRRPFRAHVEIHEQHAIGDLEVGRDRIREIAARLDSVEKAGEDRCGRILLDRSA